jgi:hypothetical protein
LVCTAGFLWGASRLGPALRDVLADSPAWIGLTIVASVAVAIGAAALPAWRGIAQKRFTGASLASLAALLVSARDLPGLAIFFRVADGWEILGALGTSVAIVMWAGIAGSLVPARWPDAGQRINASTSRRRRG